MSPQFVQKIKGKTMIKGEIDFILEKKISFSHQGHTEQTDKLVLTAPSFSLYKYALRLEQYISKAQTDLLSSGILSQLEGIKTDDDNESKKKKKKEDDSILMLLNSSNVDMQNVFETFIDLLCSGVCKIDGKEEMTKFIVKEISLTDLKRLFCRYAESFLSY